MVVKWMRKQKHMEQPVYRPFHVLGIGSRTSHPYPTSFYSPPNPPQIARSVLAEIVLLGGVSKPDNPNQFHFIVLQRHMQRDRVNSDGPCLSPGKKGIAR